MSPSDASPKKFQTLLRRLRKEEPPAPPAPEGPTGAEPVLTQLLYAMLLADASTGQATAALRRVREAIVDLNELRVFVPDEIVQTLGERYPLVNERALRLRLMLGAIFTRQHTMSLAPIAQMPKREARAYLDSLEGVMPFAAARVAVVCLGAHAVPVDERLRDLLAGEGVIDPAMPVEDAASWVERAVKAEDALATHLAFQAWSDEHGHTPKRDKEAFAPPAPPPEAAAKNPAPARRKPAGGKGPAKDKSRT